jgi:hypothetical protein
VAWSTSYIPPSTWAAGLTGAAAVNLSASNTHLKLALFGNTVTPNPDTDPQYYGSAPWNAGEVTGVNWPAGGVAVSLAGAGLTHQAGGFLELTIATLTVADVTIAAPGAYGGILYDTSLSGMVMAAIYFGGSGQSVTADAFQLIPAASGLVTVCLVPGT